MQNSQVSLTKVTLNISTSKDQDLNLTKGEVLRGVVQAVKSDGTVSLVLKGQVIEAVSEVPVEGGQQLSLIVDDFRDGKAYLKVLTPQRMEQIENINLSANLIDMGVPAKDNNVMMARKLLQYNLPVTTTNLNQLSKAANMLGGSSPRNLEIAAFAMARGVPVNQNSLDSLVQFTSGGSALSQLVEDIAGRLMQLVQSDGESGDANVSPQTGSDSKNQLTGQVQEKIVSFPAGGNDGKTSGEQAADGGKRDGTTPTSGKTDTLAGGQTPGSGKAGGESAPVFNKIALGDLMGTKGAMDAKPTPTGEEAASPRPPQPSSGQSNSNQTAQSDAKTSSEQIAPASNRNNQNYTISLEKADGEQAAAGGNGDGKAATPGKTDTAAGGQIVGSGKTGGESAPLSNKIGLADFMETGQAARGLEPASTEKEAASPRPPQPSAGQSNSNQIAQSDAKASNEQIIQPGAKTSSEQIAPASNRNNQNYNVLLEEADGGQTSAGGKGDGTTTPPGKTDTAAGGQVLGSGKAGGESAPVLNKTSFTGLMEPGQSAGASKPAPTGEGTSSERPAYAPAGQNIIDQAAPSAIKTGSEQNASANARNNTILAATEKLGGEQPAVTDQKGNILTTPSGQADNDAGKQLPGSGKAGQGETVFKAVQDNNNAIISGKTNESTPIAAAPDKAPDNLGEKLLKHLDVLRPILDMLKIDAGENKAGIGTKLETAIYSEKDLIKGLVLLEDILKNDPAALKTPLLNDLLQKITGLEKELSGQHILNSVSQAAVDNSMNFYYFAFPVQIDNEYRLGQLRINKEIGKKGLKNQDNIRFVVSLETNRMGLVLFHCNWKKNKEIEIQGVVENQEVSNHLSTNIEQLLKGLNDLGYDTRNLGIKVVDKNENPGKLRMSLEETPINLRPLGIDITV
ncbi:MAG: hypothetical protein ABFD08_11740 [Syntrophomonas sp.]